MLKWPWKKRPFPEFSGVDQSSPKDFVLSFARDYKRWNDYCLEQGAELSSNKSRIDSMREFQRLYSSFLAPFLANCVLLQAISYGTISSFDPDRISFSDVEELSQSCRVSFVVADAQLQQCDEFVADLLGNKFDGWKLKQVYYVDPYPVDGEVNLPFL